MRFALPITILVLFAPLIQADDARGVLDAAVKAHADSSNTLEKVRAVTFTAKGTVHVVGSGVQATRNATLAGPDKARWAIDLGQGDQKLAAILTVNGVKGWQSLQGSPQKNMTPAECETVSEETLAYWLATIAPLSRKDLTIASKPDATFDSKAQRVVVVTTKGKPDMKLFFDKATNLLSKAAFDGHEAGTEIPKEFIFSEHKAFNGIKLPGKIVENKGGKKAAEWTIETYTFPDNIDPQVFIRP